MTARAARLACASGVLLGIASCGRIGFDATGASDGAMPNGDAISDGTLAIGAPAQQQTANWTSGTAFTATLAFPPATGDALIAIVGINSATVASISGGGVTWSQAAQSNVNRDVEIWYGLDASGSGATAIQVTIQSTVSDAQVNVTEWQGLRRSGSPLDGEAASNGTSTDMTTATITPAAGTNRLLIAGNRSTCLGQTFTSNSAGWTELTSPDACRYEAAYQVVGSATGGYSDDFKWSAAQIYDTVIAAFANGP